MTDQERLKWLEAEGERAYDAMYDARFGTTGHYSDAKEFFSDAVTLARKLALDDEADRLTKRLDHIKRVFRSQFS